MTLQCNCQLKLEIYKGHTEGNFKASLRVSRLPLIETYYQQFLAPDVHTAVRSYIEVNPLSAKYIAFKNKSDGFNCYQCDLELFSNAQKNNILYILAYSSSRSLDIVVYLLEIIKENRKENLNLEIVGKEYLTGFISG